MSVTALVTAAAESGSHVSPWLIGGATLLLLLILLAGLVAFGAGRDHT